MRESPSLKETDSNSLIFDDLLSGHRQPRMASYA